MTDRSAKTYTLVATVSSMTKPHKHYEVARHRVTGLLSCNCMSWAVAPTCPVCGTRTSPVEGGRDHCRCATHGTVARSCKHIRGYLRDTTTSAPVVAKKTPAPTSKPALSPVESALFTAISSLSFRLKLNDAEWRAVASKLEKHLPMAPVFTAPVETFDEGIVRRIVLED